MGAFISSIWAARSISWWKVNKHTRKDSLMKTEDKFKYCMELATYWTSRHDVRRQFEWKIILGFWGIIAAATKFLGEDSSRRAQRWPQRWEPGRVRKRTTVARARPGTSPGNQRKRRSRECVDVRGPEPRRNEIRGSRRQVHARPADPRSCSCGTPR